MTDDKLDTSLSANTIMAKLTNQFQQTRLLTSSPHLSQVVEMSITNNSSFQNYSHPDNNVEIRVIQM